MEIEGVAVHMARKTRLSHLSKPVAPGVDAARAEEMWMLRSWVRCREEDGSILGSQSRVAQGHRCALGVHLIHYHDHALGDGNKGNLVGRNRDLHCCWCSHYGGSVVESRGQGQPPSHCDVYRRE